MSANERPSREALSKSSISADGKVVGGYSPQGPGNWGRWGADDRRGTANLTTPEHVRAAAGLVRRGAVFSLALPIDDTAPRWPSRPPHKHFFRATGTDAVAGGIAAQFHDDSIELATHASTQWDGLGHVAVEGTMYNGFWAGNVTAADGDAVLGVGHVRDRFVGRGVLLDLARHLGVPQMGAGAVITPELLDDVCGSQGVSVGEGDILLLRTGHQAQWWSLVTDEERAVYWQGWPGIGASGALWLAERGVAAAASDTVGFEVMPGETEAAFPVHSLLIVDHGMTIGEMWDLEALSEDCANDRVYEFLLVAPPLYIPTAVGSPLNPIAVK